MTSASDLASLAAVLADQTRAAMCLALLDGRAWTAGELATHTGVASSTATEHLHRLHRRRHDLPEGRRGDANGKRVTVTAQESGAGKPQLRSIVSGRPSAPFIRYPASPARFALQNPG